MNTKLKKINPDDLSHVFAEFFSSKVYKIIENCITNDSIYNGKNKLDSHPDNFMTSENIIKAIKSLKAKNC